MQEQNLTDQDDVSSQKTTDNNYLQSQLLIAMPSLDDPYFHKSVTLICQHSSEGCFGLTINKPIHVTIDEVLKQLEIDSDTKPSSKNIHSTISMPALRGGPVQVEQGFIVHNNSNKKWDNTTAINDELAVTASQDILVDIAKGEGPENYLLTLGCASWEAGQIEAEILNNSWLNCPADKKIIFNMPFEDRWQGAADTLGIDLFAMSGFAGHD